MIQKEKGIVNCGNLERIYRVMQRAMQGERITIGFIGGSITQGSLASAAHKCYAYLVYRWWVDAFPKAEIEYINVGIGGTNSQFGAARVEEDLLKYQPDVVFVEFSVNDFNEEHFKETYEGLIRKLLKDEHKIAVVLVHNVRYDNMESAEEIHLEIGKAYDLPCISMKSTIYPEIVAGGIGLRDITPDGLHPNDTGHSLVAGIINYFLNKVYQKSVEMLLEERNDRLPAPITKNRYENSRRYQNYNCTPVLEGFLEDKEPEQQITQLFRNGFIAWNKGDRITFEVEGSTIGVQYRKSVKKPTPIAKVMIDGEEKDRVILDGNFEEDWGDCLYLETIAENLSNEVHKVEITITEAHENDVVPFYLVSVIGSN